MCLEIAQFNYFAWSMVKCRSQALSHIRPKIWWENVIGFFVEYFIMSMKIYCLHAVYACEPTNINLPLSRYFAVYCDI